MRSPRLLEGAPRAHSSDRFSIAISRFNQPVTDRLLEGALECFRGHGVVESQLAIAAVPGAYELPWVCQRLARAGATVVVALGAVIRGETPHFDVVASEAARGCSEVARLTGVPVVFGVLTTDTAAQAFARAGGDKGNKGTDAADTALRLAGLRRLLDEGGVFPSRQTKENLVPPGGR